LPANLTPQYYEAEENFKKATTMEEKIAAIEEMLAVIPKHKGTEKMQAELKRRLSKLREEGIKKAKLVRVDPFHVEKQGAGQVVLLGFPNAGKSALVAALTRARVKVADYPFTTTVPMAGMMPYEDVLVQLVDTPPITEDLVPPGLSGTLRVADAILVVLDAASDECLEQMAACDQYLGEKKIIRDDLPAGARGLPPGRCLVVAARVDLPVGKDNVEIMREMLPDREILTVSAATGLGLEPLRQRIFQVLDVIRVYTKVPGKEPDMKAPFILKPGSTVVELAEAVHRDLPQKMKNARVWGTVRFPGQAVPREYVLKDGDVVEISQ
jgi:ribosome-interacting GTPase 1